MFNPSVQSSMYTRYHSKSLEAFSRSGARVHVIMTASNNDRSNDKIMPTIDCTLSTLLVRRNKRILSTAQRFECPLRILLKIREREIFQYPISDLCAHTSSLRQEVIHMF